MAPHGDDMQNMEGMDDMDMSGDDSMMMTMMSVFQTDRETPLYSMAWTPTTAATYAGTCIFLVILAIVFRSLLVLRTWQESRWAAADRARRFVTVADKPGLADRISSDAKTRYGTLSGNGIEENVAIVEHAGGLAKKPWRWTVDPVRAVIDTVISAVAYLLMLAVMSMNIGYFLSVLTGVFLGSLLIGRFAANEH